jgi:hypothetical protein
VWTLILPTVLLTFAIRDWRVAAVISALVAEVLVHAEMYLDHTLNWWIITVFTVPALAVIVSMTISGVRHWAHKQNIPEKKNEADK